MRPFWQLKISLDDIRPEVWRRVVVPADIPLDRLHDVIQIVMEWEDYHLHNFTVAGRRYADLRDVRDEVDTEEEGCLSLNQLIKSKGEAFHYVYDYGDDWRHTVVLENTKASTLGDGPIACLDGARCCPPEDVGGPPGYHDFCEAMANPGHEQHEHLKNWYGRAFNPNEFDIAKVRAELAKYTHWTRGRLNLWDPRHGDLMLASTQPSG